MEGTPGNNKNAVLSQEIHISSGLVSDGGKNSANILHNRNVAVPSDNYVDGVPHMSAATSTADNIQGSTDANMYQEINSRTSKDHRSSSQKFIKMEPAAINGYASDTVLTEEDVLKNSVASNIVAREIGADDAHDENSKAVIACEDVLPEGCPTPAMPSTVDCQENSSNSQDCESWSAGNGQPSNGHLDYDISERQDQSVHSLKGDESNCDAEQAVRPKTISWSRMVKQKKQKKLDKQKYGDCNVNVDDQFRDLCLCDKEYRNNHIQYYPGKTEVQSPDMDCVDFKEDSIDNLHPLRSFNGSNKDVLLCNNNDQQYTCHHGLNICQGSIVPTSSDQKRLPCGWNGDIENHKLESFTDISVPMITRYRHISDCKVSRAPSVPTAPLAVPEVVDSSDSDIENDFSDVANERTYFELDTDNLNSSYLGETSHIYQNNSWENGVRVPENCRPGSRAVPQLPVSHSSSLESLEDIGDYIETDFPSQASKRLFACSSSGQSSSSEEEDEGCGAEDVSPQNEESGNEENSCQSFSNKRCHIHDPDCLLTCDNNDLFKLDLVGINHSVPSHGEQRTSRQGSSASAGRSGSESEWGIFMGSDSSVVFSPELDSIELDSTDLSSANSTLCNSEGNYLPSFMSPPHSLDSNSAQGWEEDDDTCTCNHGDVDCYNHYCGECREATNDLSRNRKPLFLESENRVCETSKLPLEGANFQNDACNNREKIFVKLTAFGQKRSISVSSEDEEENDFLHSEQTGDEDVAMGNLGDKGMLEGDLIVEDLDDDNMPGDHHGLAVHHRQDRGQVENNGNKREEPIYEDIDEMNLQTLEIRETEPNLYRVNGGDMESNLHTQSESEEAELNQQESSDNDNVQQIPPRLLRQMRRPTRRPSDIEKVMIWNEYEAYVLQVKQIGTSACGPTAVLNVLKAFDAQVDKDEVCRVIQTNMRMEAAPIPYYLFSRAQAGTTPECLIEGIQKITKGAIHGRFFHFYPPRKVQLLKWLGYWMKRGAVPLATLNLQRGVKPGWTIPDMWHHQMIYGVSYKGVCLTNPLETVAEETIMEQLTSDSILLIRRQDVVNRFRDWAPLNDILRQPDQRWRTMNVLGQVVNLLREACTVLTQMSGYRAQLTSHISVPAAYRAGITLYMRVNTDGYQQLLQAPELPHLDPPQS